MFRRRFGTNWKFRFPSAIDFVQQCEGQLSVSGIGSASSGQCPDPADSLVLGQNLVLFLSLGYAYQVPICVVGWPELRKEFPVPDCIEHHPCFVLL